MNKPLILVVEDDAPIRNLITTTLKTHDYRYTVADCGEAALREAATSAPDCHGQSGRRDLASLVGAVMALSDG